jgi:hypothetical protein
MWSVFTLFFIAFFTVCELDGLSAQVEMLQKICLSHMVEKARKFCFLIGEFKFEIFHLPSLYRAAITNS